MDVKWVALVLIALAIGFGMGFVSSFLIFQQNASFRMELDELERRVSSLESTLSSLNLPEIRNELDELKSTLSNITLVLRVLSKHEQYVRYERLEIPVAYVVGGTQADYYQIILELVNTGATTVMITGLFINGIPYTEIRGTTIYPSLGVILNPGERINIQVSLKQGMQINGGIAVPGVALTVTVQTATSNQYSKTIVLP